MADPFEQPARPPSGQEPTPWAARPEPGGQPAPPAQDGPAGPGRWGASGSWDTRDANAQDVPPWLVRGRQGQPWQGAEQAAWPAGQDTQGPPAERPAGPLARNPLPPARSRRVLWSELAAIYLIALLPVGLNLLLSLGRTPGATDEEPQLGLLGNTVALLITAFFSWMPVAILAVMQAANREGARGIGLNRINRADVGFGVLLWLGSHLVVVLLSLAFSSLPSNDVSFLPEGLPLWFLAIQSVVIAVTAGVTEEVVMRGFAQTRLEQLRMPAAVVVLAPLAVWALLHLYQGISPTLTIFGLGLVYALWFWRTRRLWPLIIAHTMFDLTTLVLIMATS